MSASDEVLAVWRYCLNKGTELLELMSNPTAPSVWNGDPTVTFQTYGYTFARVPESLPYNPQRGNAYNRLGISTEPDHWTIMKADHENSFRIGDKIYGVCRIQILDGNTFANNAIKLVHRYMVQEPLESPRWSYWDIELMGLGHCVRRMATSGFISTRITGSHVEKVV